MDAKSSTFLVRMNICEAQSATSHKNQPIEVSSPSQSKPALIGLGYKTLKGDNILGGAKIWPRTDRRHLFSAQMPTEEGKQGILSENAISPLFTGGSLI